MTTSTRERLRFATVQISMRTLGRILLVPFWLLGFAVGLVAVAIVFVWYATSTGWDDAFDRHGGIRR